MPNIWSEQLLLTFESESLVELSITLARWWVAESALTPIPKVGFMNEWWCEILCVMSS